ncbi:MAG: KTSC domain-containing protein [Methanomicrobiales archaeon]|nr:KTSC domain-containing protein [Methanomicrobiales archaeon]
MSQERSTGIISIGYDPTTRSLLVICESGDAYRYAGITKEVYEDLIAAPSREGFVRDRVQGRYPREKYPCLTVGEEI